jgi:hypothetical protein
MQLRSAGFSDLSWHEIGQSETPALCGLENVSKMSPEFLALETMTIEARKPR